MTRINVVPVSELCDQHLLAEYRELPRIFGLVKHAQDSGKTPADCDIPEQYLLGKGHVKFFYNKLSWLCMRFQDLVHEMELRGFKAQYKMPVGPKLIAELNPHWWGHYSETADDLTINRARINERLSSMEPRYSVRSAA